MMKRLILAAMAVLITLPAAITTKAQDDVYYSRKNSRKQAYESTSNDVWSTKANDDWDVDALDGLVAIREKWILGVITDD